MAGAPLGNQNAKNKRLWRAAIERALEKRTSSRLDGLKEIDALADKLLELVASGDLAALREFGDRIDGKPAQTIIGDNDEDPVNIKTSGIIDLVRPTGS